jgi:glycoside/pentoside/hexuronide:cation symporter, GPH family
MGWFVIGALVFSIPVLLSLFAERPAAPVAAARGLAPRTLLRQLLDPLVLRVMASDFAVSLGQGCRGALLLFFITQYMQLPQWMGVLMLVQFGFGILVAPLWLKLSYRLGKQRTLIVAESLQVALNLSLLLLQPGQVAALLALTVALGLVQASGNLMLRSIVADVADAQRLKTGEECSGLLFSIFNVTSNAAMAISVGIVLPLVGAFGFVPGAANSAPVLDRLHWLFALAPAAGHLCSALLIMRFPLDERRQAEIVRALQERDALQLRAAGAAPAAPVEAVPTPNH